jgi:hypothetical protein
VRAFLKMKYLKYLHGNTFEEELVSSTAKGSFRSHDIENQNQIQAQAMVKYSKKFNRDYEFYLSNKVRFTFCGDDPDRIDDLVIVDMTSGVSAKESFKSYDSKGRTLPTYEPQLLKSIIICKKSINLHIKMWVEGYDDMMEGVDFYMDMFDGQVRQPPWVEDSFRKQLVRKRMKTKKNSILELNM